MLETNERFHRHPDGPPVKNGDIIRLTIQDTGKRGDGLGYHRSYVIIVPGTTIGQSVVVRVGKVFPRYGFGTVVPPEEIPEEMSLE